MGSKPSEQSLCLLLATLLTVASGCATVTSGPNAEVMINSYPQAAHVNVRNEKGDVVARGTTPAKVQLKRGNGMFHKAPRYTATIQKPGFEPSQVEIKPKVNPWILGNVALGGVIGLAADSASGAMWRYSPKEINQDLTPYQGSMVGQIQDEQVSQVAYTSDQ
jgi:hypothetical protein